jgi:hypothetical protein
MLIYILCEKLCDPSAILSEYYSRISRILYVSCPIIPTCKDRIILLLDIEWNKGELFYDCMIYCAQIFL